MVFYDFVHLGIPIMCMSIQKILATLSISQMVQLSQDPEGKKVFAKTRPTEPSARSRSDTEQGQTSFDAHIEAVKINGN